MRITYVRVVTGQSYAPMTPGGMYADYTAPSPFSDGRKFTFLSMYFT